MKRRDFIHYLSLTGAATLCGCASAPVRYLERLATEHLPFLHKGSLAEKGISPEGLSPSEGGSSDIAEVVAPQETKILTPQQMSEELIKDARAKSVYFSQDFPDDIYFRDRKYELLKSLVTKFRAVQRYVGHGHFNILGMDEFFRLAEKAKGSSAITNEEKLFLEELFYFDAKNYGFYGDKVVHKMTETIRRSDVEKIPYTGHYLRKGLPIETYKKIQKDVGNTLILTSGVRALAKQYHLFLEKGLETQGNMSKASRSLAPPGYSFHGQHDFDIGKVGFGYNNFTDAFATTDEYKRLLDLGYIQIRYSEMNTLGVRFEPWHIKIHT